MSDSSPSNGAKSKRYTRIEIFLLGAFALLLVFITFSSAVYVYEKRVKIMNFLTSELGTKNYEGSDAHAYWAKEILKGGYILHFRHAEREKWIDVQMYDALESDVHQNGIDESRYAENDYFNKAVCLNDRGKIQARAIGEHISNIGLPIGVVVSSVSCRARQTAELAFGGYQSLHRILVHSGPYNEDNEQRIRTLKKFYTDLPIVNGKNTIVSAHNSVVQCAMFKNHCDKKLSIEEGGFFVIKQRDGGLYLEHKFHSYNAFNLVFYSR